MARYRAKSVSRESQDAAQDEANRAAMQKKKKATAGQTPSKGHSETLEEGRQLGPQRIRQTVQRFLCHPNAGSKKIMFYFFAEIWDQKHIENLLNL